MTVPHSVRIGVLVVATTAFYRYVGQIVPQKEVQPPQEIAIRTDLTTPEMAKVGREIMKGKGLCFTCHTIGKSGALRFPDLEGVDVRAKTPPAGPERRRVLRRSRCTSPTPTSCQGFNPGMPHINQPPIGLTDQEILCVIAYLQTLGGTPTVTLQTTHRYNGGTAAPGAAQPPSAMPPPGGPGGAQPPAVPPKGARLIPAHSTIDGAAAQ